MSAPLVSIVVPARNAEAWIGEAIGSAGGQTTFPREIILVDDGSSDRTVEEAKRACSDIRVIRQDGRGASQARNAGTAAAHGEFLLYLDADDVLMPGTVAARVAALTESAADVAYTNWTRWIEDAEGTYRDDAVPAETLGDRPDVELLTGKWWPPGALMYRRTIVDRIGGWREDLPVIQDARFHLDAALAGATFVHVASVGMRYRVVRGGSSLSRRDPGAFLADCYHNARTLEEDWRRRGTLDEPRRRALLQVYGMLARGFYARDRRRFDELLARLYALDPDYLPDRPASLRVLARLIGYRRAEGVALVWRRAKVAGRR